MAATAILDMRTGVCTDATPPLVIIAIRVLVSPQIVNDEIIAAKLIHCRV
jgi:hypothetical protein